MLKIRQSRRRKPEDDVDSFLRHATFVYFQAPTELPSTTEGLYRTINKVERSIGGDSGLIGMSGSVARPDMTRILAAFQVSLPASHFLDVGSGLGRPMLHALLAGAAQVSGIEFDAMKHGKSQTVISRVLPLCDQVRTCCHHVDVLNLRSLADLDTGFTHVFSFWEGINMDAREAVARLVTQDWNQGGSITSLAFVQEHVHGLDSYMHELGFPQELALVDTFPVTMIGSASKFRAYIFRFPKRSQAPTLLNAVSRKRNFAGDLKIHPDGNCAYSKGLVTVKNECVCSTPVASDTGCCNRSSDSLQVPDTKCPLEAAQPLPLTSSDHLDRADTSVDTEEGG